MLIKARSEFLLSVIVNGDSDIFHLSSLPNNFIEISIKNIFISTLLSILAPLDTNIYVRFESRIKSSLRPGAPRTTYSKKKKHPDRSSKLVR